jgi:hypothetical protein
METVLISFSICVLGVVGAVSLFSVAMRSRGEEDEAQTPGPVTDPSSGFFLGLPAEPEAPPHLSSGSLQRQLERHFRLEERAAASFLEHPTSSSLHATSSSPLWE